MENRNRLLRNIIVSLILVAAVGGAIWSGASGNGSSTEKATDSASAPSGQKGSREERPIEGFRAPDFTLKTLDGKTVTLSDNGGKPALINFWASWCPPCKVEMPYLQQAYEKYGDQVHFHMVNLTVSDQKEKMESYLTAEKFTFPVLLDETGEVRDKYNAFSIPQTFVVNEQGEIIYHFTGAVSAKHIEQIMKELTS